MSPDHAWCSHSEPSARCWYSLVSNLRLALFTSWISEFSAAFRCCGVLGVDVGDSVVEQPHRQPLVLVVEQADLARDLRPLASTARSTGWPGWPDRSRAACPRASRSRWCRSCTAPCSGCRRRTRGCGSDGHTFCSEVGDVAQVDRLEHLADDEPLEEHELGHEHVELNRPARDLRDRLVDRRERADLDLDPVLLLERLDHVGVDVRVPVVELERPLLGREPRGDRLVVGVDRKRHRPVGTRQRQATRSDGPPADDAEVALTCGVVLPHASSTPGTARPAAATPARRMNVLRVLPLMSSLLSSPRAPLGSSSHPSSTEASARQRSTIRSARHVGLTQRDLHAEPVHQPAQRQREVVRIGVPVEVSRRPGPRARCPRSACAGGGRAGSTCRGPPGRAAPGPTSPSTASSR